MRLAGPERPLPKRPKRLAHRVALASAVAAAIGGASAALAVGTAATRLLNEHDDETLRAAAQDLADEVVDEVDEYREEHGLAPNPWSLVNSEREGVDVGRAAFAAALADELDEVDDLPGVRARIDGAAGYLAGEHDVPTLHPGTCSDRVVGGVGVRACGVSLGEGTLTLAMLSEAADVRDALLAWSVLLGLIIGAVLGGGASFFASVWALRPLQALSTRVGEVRPADPQPAVLEPPLAYAELETLRVALVQLLVQLSAALTSARGFASAAAHELRTPLTSLVGELELLAERATPADALVLEQVRNRAADLVSLTQRLLILAQLDAIAPDAAQAVDLSDVVDAVHQTLPSPDRARLRDMCEDDVLVRGDATLLGALLSNAVDNALKFSSEEVVVTARNVGDEVVLEVRDTGPGIPAHEQERVFEPFYRSRDARSMGTSGHGVGLALIAHVARVHRGTATVGSALGGGALLTVRLPRFRPRGH